MHAEDISQNKKLQTTKPISGIQKDKMRMKAGIAQGFMRNNAVGLQEVEFVLVESDVSPRIAIHAWNRNRSLIPLPPLAVHYSPTSMEMYS
jgi:hypothetical protein